MWIMYLDTEKCPNVANAMGITGLMNGYPISDDIYYDLYLDDIEEWD